MHSYCPSLRVQCLQSYGLLLFIWNISIAVKLQNVGSRSYAYEEYFFFAKEKMIREERGKQDVGNWINSFKAQRLGCIMYVLRDDAIA